MERGKELSSQEAEGNEEILIENDKDFEDDPVIQKAYEKAKKEGRVDGPYQCPVCGMKYNNRWFAEHCCKIIKNEDN